jgi:hypothetical protein
MACDGTVRISAIRFYTVEGSRIGPRLGHAEVHSHLAASTAPSCALQRCELLLGNTVVHDSDNIIDVEALKKF